MKNGQKYLTVYLRNGMTFDVEGETLNDFPRPIPNSHGDPWYFCKTLHGQGIQISSSEIVAIKESQVYIEEIPW